MDLVKVLEVGITARHAAVHVEPRAGVWTIQVGADSQGLLGRAHAL